MRTQHRPTKILVPQMPHISNTFDIRVHTPYILNIVYIRVHMAIATHLKCF